MAKNIEVNDTRHEMEKTKQNASFLGAPSTEMPSDETYGHFISFSLIYPRNKKHLFQTFNAQWE